MEPSPLLLSPSPPLPAHHLDCDSFGSPICKALLNKIITLEETELFLATYMYACRYDICVSNSSDPLLTQSNGNGILSTMCRESSKLCADHLLIKLYFYSNIYLNNVLLAPVYLQRNIGLIWTRLWKHVLFNITGILDIFSTCR